MTHSLISFQSSVTSYMDTSHLTCRANQMTGFYMKLIIPQGCNTRETIGTKKRNQVELASATKIAVSAFELFLTNIADILALEIVMLCSNQFLKVHIISGFPTIPSIQSFSIVLLSLFLLATHIITKTWNFIQDITLLIVECGTI